MKLTEPVLLDVDRDVLVVEWNRWVGPLLGIFKDCSDAPPAAVRAALRRLGISRITVTPEADGWKVEGIADLSLLLGTNGASSGGSIPHLSLVFEGRLPLLDRS